MKIGLVCPYIYPEPGGVAQHVRYLYENLRLRGHDVRIITASHGPQRASEGDILRIGVGFSVPANGSIGTLTFSPRYIGQVRELLERERFDLLHFHEPFVPFLSLFLLRESRSVNVATFHAYAGFSPSYEFGSRVMGGYARRLHGRIAVSAAARHFIDRFFPGDYKVIPNGVDVAAVRRRRADRALAGRHAERPVRRPARAAQGPARPAQGAPDPAPDRVREPAAGRRLGAAGARGAPLRRDPRPAGASSSSAGSRDAEKAQLFRTADVYVSPATGGESFGIVLLEAMAAGAPIVASDIHGYKGVVRRGREGLLVPPHEPKRAGRGHRPTARRPGAARRDERGRPRPGGGVQLAAGDRQGRGLLRLRHPPAGRDGLAARRTSARRSLRRRRRSGARPSRVVRR